MIELFKKGVFTGLGLGLMAKEKVEETAKSIAEECKLSEEQGRKLYEEMLKKSESSRTDLESQVEQFVDSAIAKMKELPTSDDLEKKWEDRIANLESKIERLNNLADKIVSKIEDSK